MRSRDYTQSSGFSCNRVKIKDILDSNLLSVPCIRVPSGIVDVAVRIYADAHNRDPEFYAFLQTLETYRKTIGNNSKLFMTTESDLYRYLKKVNMK